MNLNEKMKAVDPVPDVPRWMLYMTFFGVLFGIIGLTYLLSSAQEIDGGIDIQPEAAPSSTPPISARILTLDEKYELVKGRQETLEILVSKYANLYYSCRAR